LTIHQRSRVAEELEEKEEEEEEEELDKIVTLISSLVRIHCEMF